MFSEFGGRSLQNKMFLSIFEDTNEYWQELNANPDMKKNKKIKKASFEWTLNSQLNESESHAFIRKGKQAHLDLPSVPSLYAEDQNANTSDIFDF